MTDLSIRRYRPDDRERVLELYEESQPGPGGVPDPGLNDVQSHYLDPGGEFLVGLVDGHVVAIAAFRPVDEATAGAFDSLGTPAAELDQFRVAPDRQQRGDGQRIYEELERRARESGVTELVVDVPAEREGACRFYEQNDFAVERRVEIETGDETIETVFYRKAL